MKYDLRWAHVLLASSVVACGAKTELVAPHDGSIGSITTHYAVSRPSTDEVAFIDACAAAGHMAVLAGADDGSTQVPLAFAFRYWTTDLAAGSPVNVVSNGWIGMNGLNNASFTPSLPNANAPNSVIAPYWGDGMNRMASPQCIATVGNAPHRSMVFEWHDAAYCCPADSMPAIHNTYEVILAEDTGTIDFVYQEMVGSREQAVGLENETGTVALSGCATSAMTCAPTTGARIRFTPVP